MERKASKESGGRKYWTCSFTVYTREYNRLHPVQIVFSQEEAGGAIFTHIDQKFAGGGDLK
jgi:hypothetical protein